MLVLPSIGLINRQRTEDHEKHLDKGEFTSKRRERNGKIAC